MRERPDDGEDLYQLMKTLNNVGRLSQLQQHPEEAEATYQACRDAYDRWTAKLPPQPRHDGMLAMLLGNWSSLSAEAKKPDLQLKKLQEAIAVGERVTRAVPGDVWARGPP